MFNLGRKIFYCKNLPVPTKAIKQMIKEYSPIQTKLSLECVWLRRMMMAGTIKGICYKTLFFKTLDMHLQPCLTFVIEARGLPYKTFLGRNLRIFVIS
jgi:hypothetical protein